MFQTLVWVMLIFYPLFKSIVKFYIYLSFSTYIFLISVV